LKNFWTLLILMLIGVLGLYFLGGGTIEIPVERWEQRDQGRSAGLEMNARGVQELADGDAVSAVDTLRQAAQVEPRNPVILRNLSIALARSAMIDGRSEREAMKMLRESLGLWPQNPEALDGMSTIHYRKAMYSEALDYAIKLQKILPDRPDIHKYVAHLSRRAAGEMGMVSEKGDYFRLLYSGEKRLEYEGEILALLQTQMDALTAALGVFPDRAVDVLILTDDLGGRADPLESFLDGLYDGRIRLYVGAGIDDQEKLILTVRHEMIHALLHIAAGVLPGWIQEGLAQKVGENPSEEQLRAVRRFVVEALRRGHDVNLNSLDLSFIGLESEERKRAYATSLLFMDWLTKKFGENFIPTFVSELSSGKPPFRAIHNVTGMELDRLQETFNQDLKGYL
jgi:tetratricopeptide (TPR) repeat protein